MHRAHDDFSFTSGKLPLHLQLNLNFFFRVRHTHTPPTWRLVGNSIYISTLQSATTAVAAQNHRQTHMLHRLDVLVSRVQHHMPGLSSARCLFNSSSIVVYSNVYVFTWCVQLFNYYCCCIVNPNGLPRCDD